MIPGSANPLLLTSAAAAGGYEIERSLRFDSSSSAYLSRTPASAGNRTTWTWAGWVKRSTASNYDSLFTTGSSNNTLMFNGPDQNSAIQFYDYNGSSFDFNLITSQVFRDFSAWYHVVVAVDTTQATAANRIKLYVNGSQITAFATSTYPNQDFQTNWNTTGVHAIGRWQSGTSRYLSGYLADVHFIDGQALDPTSFGEFDANGIWQPIEYTGGYGLVSVANATGALPIYNTTDTYGATKGTGTRTDDNASSLVLAIPMDGANNGTTFTDESATIKGSGSAKTITRSGDSKTSTAQSKFYGSSGLFDSSGDVLTVPAGTDFAYGTGDFTVEAWIYPQSSSEKILYTQAVSGTNYFVIIREAAGTISFYGTLSGGGTAITSTNTTGLNTWSHVAVTRQSGTIKIYINGVSSASGSNTTNFTNTTYVPTIGAYTHSTGNSWGGYIEDFRIYKGVAKYTSNFTPVVSSNNSFHLPFSDNSTAAALGTDTSGYGNDWTVNNISLGPAVISDSWSGYFRDSVGDQIQTASSSQFGMGTGDWTVEGWFLTEKAAGGINVAWHIGDINTTDGMAGGVASDKVAFRSNGITDISATVSISGAWTHVAWVKSSNTVKIYVNGSSVTNGTYTNSISNGVFTIGYYNTSFRFGGYISNLRVLKGTALYTSSFTPPSSPLTAITNTSLLALQDSSFIDNSTNNFTLSATGATVSSHSPFEDSFGNNDSLVDVPTNGSETDTGIGGEVRGNYATWLPTYGSTGTFTNGNLNVTTASSNSAAIPTSIFPSSGKWYCEVLIADYAGRSDSLRVGICNTLGVATGLGTNANTWCFLGDGRLFHNNSSSSYGVSVVTGDIVNVALDLDAGKIWYGKNGTWMASGSPSTGANPSQSFTANQSMSPAVASGIGSPAYTLNAGQRPFAYAAPSGFKSLNTANLPTPTIADGSTAMDIALYTGNGSTQTISGLEFSPDLLWFKDRSSGTSWHGLFDSVRGNTKVLSSNNTTAEATYSNEVTTFNSDGFSLGASTTGYTNYGSQSYVAWAWDAGSSSVTNTAGSINSTVRANPSAGFSIVSYTGNSTAGATVGHGLNVTPALIIVKNLDLTKNWAVYHASASASPATGYLRLNSTAGFTTGNTIWNDTAPTSSVFSVGTSDLTNLTTNRFIAYCFAPVESYGSFGSYLGNGNSDGPFVYTGFRPRWILIKNVTATGSWVILDTERSTYNVSNLILQTNNTDAEAVDTYSNTDFLSNGFKARGSGTFGMNISGSTYVYIAFAEHPFSLARAR